MKREELVSEIAGPTLRVLGLIQGVFIFLVLVSPFVWIWLGWSLAWKIGLSGIVGVILIYFIYNRVQKTIKNVVDECLDNLKHDPKS